jgi:hypothetical protein
MLRNYFIDLRDLENIWRLKGDLYKHRGIVFQRSMVINMDWMN